MRVSAFLLFSALLMNDAAQAGLLGKILWGAEGERTPLLARGGVKMLELEVVDKPKGAVKDEFASLKFRVKQLTDPDPQYIGPPLRVRRFSLSGTQLDQQWIHPNGAGIYETSVRMSEATRHYLYFETGNNRTVLTRVPWVVLQAAAAGQ